MSTVRERLDAITFLIDVVMAEDQTIVAPLQRFFQIAADGSPDESDVLVEAEILMDQLGIQTFEICSHEKIGRFWIPYRFQYKNAVCYVRVYRPLPPPLPARPTGQPPGAGAGGPPGSGPAGVPGQGVRSSPA